MVTFVLVSGGFDVNAQDKSVEKLVNEIAVPAASTGTPAATDHVVLSNPCERLKAAIARITCKAKRKVPHRPRGTVPAAPVQPAPVIK